MKKIHHIGYLVKKLERAQAAFEALGFAVEGTAVRDELRKVDIVFLTKDGYRIELVSPYDSTSVVAEMLRRVGNSPYHVCYESDDCEAEIGRLRELHFVVSSDLMIAPALNNRRVCFLIHPYLGMIELIDNKKEIGHAE